MEEITQRLASDTWAMYEKTPPTKRLMIAISGIPGSGKTSLATALVARLNALQAKDTIDSKEPPVAIMIPMDGFHLTRAQLAAMPDPANALYRRGAEFTFTGAGFHALVQSCREPIGPESPTIYAPSFDHKIKDPVENDINIAPTARILIFEGIYLSLNKEPWSSAAAMMDRLWFIETDHSTALARMIPRHVAAGICADPQAAETRIRDSDLRNAAFIEANRLDVHENILSVPDPSWVAVQSA